MKMSRRLGNRGSIILSAYLVLSVFLVYSNAMSVRTLTQARAADRLRDQFQAMNLAQGAIEQLREDLHYFLNYTVNATGGGGQWSPGDAVRALQWLDSLGTQSEVPMFDVSPTPVNLCTGDCLRDGMPTNPRCISGLPTINQTTCRPVGETVQAPRAWIVSIASTNPGNSLAARRVTIDAEAAAGSVTKRLRATYTVDLGMSDIFRYSYFINNYGWFSVTGASSLLINGEVRANGNVAFLGNVNNMRVHGDISASSNPELKDPGTLLPATGTITGDPNQWSRASDYWSWKSSRARPARRLTFSGQPAIGGGTAAKVLPYGQGWNTESRQNPQPAFPEQQKFTGQPTQDIPYLGDLNLYKSVANQLNSRLTFYEKKTVTFRWGRWTWTYTALVPRTVNAVYKGPDGKTGNAADSADDSNPLVLDGSYYPITIDGPVVIPGDVIIKGNVTGQGTIYSGRNVHVVGDVNHRQPPEWVSLERYPGDGRIRRKDTGAILGRVCNDGTYLASGSCP